MESPKPKQAISLLLIACTDIFLSRKHMTEYVIMSLAASDIGAWWGRAAHLSSWILLQGYVIFPSTFTAYNLAGLDDPPGGTSILGKIKKEIFYLIRHVPV
jgi:hypothetical protein